jgi:hypothetical protein
MRTKKDNYFFVKSNMFLKLVNLRDCLYLKTSYIDYDKASKSDKEKNETEIEYFETNFKIYKLQKSIDEFYNKLKLEIKENKYDESSNLFDY